MPELCAVGGRTGEGGDPAQDDRVRKPVESLRAQRESSKRGRVSEIGRATRLPFAPRAESALHLPVHFLCGRTLSALFRLFRLIH